MNTLRKTIQTSSKFSPIIRQIGDKATGSGTAGSIRAAGGAFARMEAAHEDEYFYKLREQQLHDLKLKKVNEKQFRKMAIKDHEEAIQRHKEAIKQLDK